MFFATSLQQEGIMFSANQLICFISLLANQKVQKTIENQEKMIFDHYEEKD